MKTYSSYVWRDGIPYGRGEASEGEGYAILSDPYHKRISVELFRHNQWVETVYDSAHLDFRHLKPQFQAAWEQERIGPLVTHLRDENGRLAAIENYTLSDGRCVKCEIRSPQGVLIARQAMHYTDRGDAFNGAVLSDSAGFSVRYNRYDGPEYQQLLADEWDMLLEGEKGHQER